MDKIDTLEWSAPEYEERDRSNDWFWALGIIVIAGSVTAIILDNYFFAALIILGGIMLGFFAKKKPEMIHYQLNEKGLKIASRVYPYENIKSFYVQTNLRTEHTTKPTLFIHTERLFMPVISIPIEDEWAEQIHNIMIFKNVPEVEMKEHPSEKIMESLGF